MKMFLVLTLIVPMLAACQSGGGSAASLNTTYTAPNNCYSYDYSNTGGNWCLGRQWR